MIFHGADGSHQHHGRGLQTCHTALDVNELFRTQVGAEAGLGNHIIRQLQCGPGRGHAVAAVGNIGKRPAMHKGQVVFQGLHQVRFDGVFQQRRHCPVGVQVAGMHRLSVATGVADDNSAESFPQVGERGRQTEYSHDFRGNGDVVTVFPRETVGRTAEGDDDLAQGPVIHVHNPFPGNQAGVKIQPVAVVDVVVKHCRQQVVRGAYCMKVAGKVQVDVFHRHDLGITTAGSATLDSEAGTKRRFAQAYQGLPAGPVHGIAQTDRGRGLALPRRRRTDGSGQDQFAVGVVLQAVNIVQ